MTNETQKQAYEDSEEINSDPFGLIDRDNRNHRKKQEIILSRLPDDPETHILEVGCGHGLHSVGYESRFQYTGIDLSESLVQKTAEKINSPNVLQMDAMDLTFDDDVFDSVVGTAILHHTHDQQQALEEWARVAKDKVVLMEPNYLFPKDLLTAHLIEEEQHKTGMAPWRLRQTVESVSGDYNIEPHIYTPPWPEQAHGMFDWIDSTMQKVPVAKWSAQMLLIEVKV